MKIFISYKQTGVEDKELIEKLTELRKIIENLGHETFIYYFDTDFREKTPKEIIQISKQEIEKADIVLGFIHYETKSEGMMLELGIAFGLEKKIMILMNNLMQDEYYLTYGVSNNTILFNNFGEIENILYNELPHK